MEWSGAGGEKGWVQFKYKIMLVGKKEEKGLITESTGIQRVARCIFLCEGVVHGRSRSGAGARAINFKICR